MSQDVVDLIMSDHREVERLFETLKSDPGSRPGLTPVLTTLLTAHSRAEESDVYPAARDEAGIAEDVKHSQEEHLLADQLLAELADCDPASPAYDTALAKLVDAVTHHVEEEESTVLPGMRKGLSTERRAELGQAFLDSRAEHLGEQPDDITRDQLAQQARNIDVPTSGKSKDELAKELSEHAEDE
ncbi:hemerythrin domain-containing protein [Nocardioides seonyuensis]|uniref:Hemerythrin domain-containing protein n=1 Tax=Nocardioides seonyuensis TaxID=2518371 RepID=A0A4P7IJG8_9ACTN|nr:hemerythrin domain-containing protein [Nocardioides seonyuensis]QBX56437.1 hemerythrin domain-containing protein [Nocardioides seonyuensis]